jgi:hypothetical protein
MTVFIIAAYTLIISTLTLALGLMSRQFMNPGKALFLHHIFIIPDVLYKDGIYNALLLKLLQSLCAVSLCCFFSSSNHFVITLDIIISLCMLIPIRYQNLKIIKTLPAR